MTQTENPQEELLKEARRTTHAVRAIARFVLLIVSYQVFAAISAGLGVGLYERGADDAAFGFILVGVFISVAGLVHALMAGRSELELSHRKTSVAPTIPVAVETRIPRDENGLLEGVCSCTKWERAGATAVNNGVNYCTRCERVISS